MSRIQRFAEYAAAFEVAVEKDDWSGVEPHFTEGAVYETFGGAPFAGCWRGRPAVLEHLKESLDGFDRRFDARELELLEGPLERDGSVWLRWRATYRLGGAPPLVMEGEETAVFEGDRISRLEDRFSPESAAATVAYLEEHGAALPPAP